MREPGFTVSQSSRHTRVSREIAGDTQWELAMRTPALPLAPLVRELQGYVEVTPAPLKRRQFPGPQVVVIIELGPTIRVYDSGQEHTFARHAGGFVAGPDDAFTQTEHLGLQTGIQLNLQPLAARRLFGVPLSELRGRIVQLTDLLPCAWRDLSDRLRDLPTWAARFDLVETLLRSQLSEADESSPAVAWTLEKLAAAGGTLDLRDLTRELGYSHKHLIALFHDQVGMPPKLWMRLLRFDRLRDEMQRRRDRSWAELAVLCGYYDQAHLARDVRQFAGCTPSRLRSLMTNEPETP
ncbi:MAG TPA: helix-turn-helix domain-containing protein [Polyangiales bacterium]|nr:helix-turn-helix domain-containing protein [Polyangiales bacterium]